MEFPCVCIKCECSDRENCFNSKCHCCAWLHRMVMETLENGS